MIVYSNSYLRAIYNSHIKVILGPRFENMIAGFASQGSRRSHAQVKHLQGAYEAEVSQLPCPEEVAFAEPLLDYFCFSA